MALTKQQQEKKQGDARIYLVSCKLVLGSINSDKNNNNNNINKVAPVVSNGNGGRTSGVSASSRSSTESKSGTGNGGAGHVRFGGATIVGDEEEDHHDDGVESVDNDDRDSDLDREGDGGLSSRIGPT
ncbi:hypothetical protein MKW94_021372, partial [Papaver nudicaule]|nr:hypothetical protein [Papaver nudicaule]